MNDLQKSKTEVISSLELTFLLSRTKYTCYKILYRNLVQSSNLSNTNRQGTTENILI